MSPALVDGGTWAIGDIDWDDGHFGMDPVQQQMEQENIFCALRWEMGISDECEHSYLDHPDWAPGWRPKSLFELLDLH